MIRSTTPTKIMKELYGEENYSSLEGNKTTAKKATSELRAHRYKDSYSDDLQKAIDENENSPIKKKLLIMRQNHLLKQEQQEAAATKIQSVARGLSGKDKAGKLRTEAKAKLAHKDKLNPALAELKTNAEAKLKAVDTSKDATLENVNTSNSSPSIGIKVALATTAVTAGLVGLATYFAITPAVIGHALAQAGAALTTSILPAVAAFMLTPTGIGLGIGLLLAATALVGYLATSKTPTEVLEIDSPATTNAATKIQSAFIGHSVRNEIAIAKEAQSDSRSRSSSIDSIISDEARPPAYIADPNAYSAGGAPKQG